MKTTITRTMAGTLAAAATALAGAATAQEFSTNIAVTSDYVWRGASQSDGDFAVSGGIDYTHGIFYAGTWASTVDFGDGTDAEWDFYLGITPSAGGFDWDVGVTFYTYVGDPSGSDYNFTEFKVAAERSDGPLTWGGELHFSPNFTGGAGEALYAQANLAYEVAPSWSVSAALGHQWLDGADYLNWNLGVSYAINDTFGIDVRYHDTDVHAWGSIFGDRVAVTLTAGF